MRRIVSIVVLTLLLGAVAATPASAAERTAVFQLNVNVPVFNVAAIGTLTVVYDDESGNGTWTFQGTVDGQPAYASGTGTFDTSSASGIRSMAGFAQTTAQLTMTGIDNWQVPRFSAYTPRTATIRTVGELAYVDYQGRELSVTGVPLAMNPPLSFPVEGNFVVTDAGSGQEPVTVLPGTGAGPVSSAGSSQSALPVAASVLSLLAIAGIWTWTRMKRPVRQYA